MRLAGSKSRCMGALDEAAFAGMGLRAGEFRLFEPMCGSLAVTLHVLRTYRPAECVVADASPHLVNLFGALATPDGHGAFLDALRAEGLEVDADRYAALRARHNAHPATSTGDPDPRAAAVFYLLTRSSFNGVYRENSRGGFNVPFGRFSGGAARVGDAQLAQVRALHEALAGGRVRVTRADFRDFFARELPGMRPGDLVYCDPPYLGTFSAYLGASPFGHAEHAELERMCRLARDAGAHVAVSNSNSTAARELFAPPRWTLRPVVVRRSVSADAAARGQGAEDLLALAV